MIKNNIKKILGTMLTIIILIINMNTFVQAATDITSADLTYVKDCGNHLQAKDEKGWYTIVASYVEYKAQNGKTYPAYCLDNTKPGVGNPNIGDLPDGYTVDITKLLDNDKVYTAVINGYPYKTPEDMGLENKYDAYIATKQAIYSVLYGYDVDSHYKGVDEKGENIKKAIKKIVKIAREQTKTQTSALIKFDKVGTLEKDPISPEYYSQIYKISSDVSMKNYTITEIKEFTKNTIITDMDNKEKNTFNGDEQFKILIPKNEVSDESNIKGKISAIMKCKTYPIFYGEKSSKLQPYALTYDTYGENPVSTTLEIELKKGQIKVIKLDADNKEIKLKDVEFEIIDQNGNVLENIKTNEKGEAISKKYNLINYPKLTIREEKTKEGYILNETPQTITLKENEIVEVIFSNKKISEKPKIPEVPKKLPRTGF